MPFPSQHIQYEQVNGDELLYILLGKDLNRYGKLLIDEEEIVVIENIELTNGITYKGHSFEKNIIIKSGIYQRLTFDRCVFEGKVIIAGSEFHDLEFICCEFRKGFYINGGQFIGPFRIHAPETRDIDIRNCHFFNSPMIYGTQTARVNLTNCYTDSEFKLHLSGNSELILKDIRGQYSIHDMYIDGRVEIEINHLDSTLIHMTRSSRVAQSLSHLQIGTVGKGTVIHLNNLRIQYIIFRDALILGSLSLTSIDQPDDFRNKASLQIFSSDLGNTHFNDCNFENFTLYLQNALISNCIFSGTVFPDPTHINQLSKNESSQSLTIRQEAFSQLKKIFEAKGDLIMAANYRTLEFECYKQSLKWGENFQDKLIISLNQFSNGHNQKWIRPMLLLLLFSLLFFYFYCNALVRISISNFSKKLFLFNYYLEFINPLHSPNFIPDQLDVKKVPGDAIAWENIHRIVASYFIYQFIQAFRKHGKS